MAFSSSNLNIGLVYDLTNNPKNFRLIDNTDYSDLTYSNVLGLLRAVDPSGSQFYNNVSFGSPDIDLSSSNESAFLGSLPLQSGLVRNGNYGFTYSIKIEEMLQSHTVVSSNIATNTFTVNGNIAAEVVSGTAADWEIVDSGTTTLTIVSATYSAITGLTTIIVNETLPLLTGLAQFQYIVDKEFSKPFTQAYTYQTPSVCIDWASDECCSEMTITDSTAYPAGATITRLHDVSYPPGMVTPQSNVTSPLQTFSISPIWTGTWTNVFTSDVEFANGIIEIVDELRSVKTFRVSASQGLCEVYSCLTNMATKYSQYLVSAPNKALEMATSINQASAAFMAYTVGKKCGQEGYEIYLELIKTVANDCGCGCNDCGPCDDQTPTQVVGCCQNVGQSTNSILIISTNGSITITSDTQENTTTFDIEVSDTFVTGLAEQAIAAASINDLDDVNTSNISAANGQVLIWNAGLGEWVRGVPALSLNELTNVDDTGLANDMVLYYDNATQTFKFKLLSAPTLSSLSDVEITSIANGQILKWNGTKWVNANNLLSLLSDVSISGITNNQILRWISANNRFERYTLIQTISGMEDITPLSVIANGAILRNNGSTWTPIYTVIQTAVSNAAFSLISGFTYNISGERIFTLRFDPVANKVSLSGSISASVITGATTTFTQIVTAYRPTSKVPFVATCYSSVDLQSYVCVGAVFSDGLVTIAFYYDLTGDVIYGPPAGFVSFDGVEWFLD